MPKSFYMSETATYAKEGNPLQHPGGMARRRTFRQAIGEIICGFCRAPYPTKRGISAILVVLDSFSKFVSFFPVRRMASSVMIDCLERGYIPAHGTPTSIVTDIAHVFRS